MPSWLPPRNPRNNTSLAAPVAVGAVAAWAWLTRSMSSKPELYVGEGKLKAKVLPHLSVLHSKYTPSPWALNVHVQNILGFTRGASINCSYRRQLVMAHDGGTLGLDWYQSCDAPTFGTDTTPVLLVLHGINGGSHEGYCKWMCHEAHKQGWRAAVMNYRGCGGLPLTSPRGYAATLTHDVHYVITSIKARFPLAPLSAVGYSLGGVFLTKYMAEADAGLHASQAANNAPFEGSGLVAAAVVSSPICLFNTATNLERPWTLGYLYSLAMAYKLREFMAEHEVAIRANTTLDYDKTFSRWTLSDMEDVGIPNTLGFANRQEYYEAASSLGYIPQVHTPTLFLLAKDDPFLGVLPDQECLANPNTLLAATKTGGHIGFLQGLWPYGPAYMEGAVLQFLDTVLKQMPERLPIPKPPPVLPAFAPGTSVRDRDRPTVLWDMSRWPGDDGPARLWLNVDALPARAASPQLPGLHSQGTPPFGINTACITQQDPDTRQAATTAAQQAARNVKVDSSFGGIAEGSVDSESAGPVHQDISQVQGIQVVPLDDTAAPLLLNQELQGEASVQPALASASVKVMQSESESEQQLAREGTAGQHGSNGNSESHIQDVVDERVVVADGFSFDAGMYQESLAIRSRL